MIDLSNQEALYRLRKHKCFLDFLNSLQMGSYPGLEINKIFFFVSTGVMLDNMPIDSTCKLLEDIKLWVLLHSHGGPRQNAGAPKRLKKLKRINLSAEESDLKKARAIAAQKHLSLQAMFRKWLKEL